MQQRRALLALAAGVSLALGATGCATSLHGLEFHNDNRMKITSPHQNQLVSDPVTLSWTMKDFAVAGLGDGPVQNDTGYFAVFIDRAPVKPGQTLAAVSGNTPSCQHTTLCTTKSYLAGEQVYTTTKDEIRLPPIADLLNNHESTQYHQATVILINTAGERISESAWTVEFRMHSSGVND
jgi:hypothetical protein